MLKGQRWRRGGDLRQAVSHIAYGLFVVGGLYMAYTALSIYDWHPGRDAAAYWRTGHPVHGLYAVLDGPERYLYSPAFAQVAAPLTHLPWPVFITLWMIAETAAFAWLLRPLGWRWVVPLLFWLAPEIVIGNILGFVGVALVLGMTRPWTWSLMLLTKPSLGVGLLWFVVRREWRRLVVALASTLAIVLLSFLWNPDLWFGWVHYLYALATTGAAGGRGGLPVRILLAVLLTAYAGRTGRAWLLPVSLLLATPVFVGGPSCTILAAVPRMWLHSRHSTRLTSSVAQSTASRSG